MNKRAPTSVWVALYWVAIGLVLMSCFVSSAEFLGSPECLLGWLTFTGGVLFGIWKFLSWLHKSISAWNTFALFFIDHGPPGQTRLDWGFTHAIPLGRQERWVEILFNRGLPLSRFNVRFVPLTARPGDPPTDVSEIIQILEIHLGQQTNHVQAGISAMVHDQHGGIDIVLNRPVTIGTGRSLFLRLELVAKQIWTGRISFQTLDDENEPRDAQKEINIVQ